MSSLWRGFWLLMAVTALCVIVLLLLPQTGWLVRAQFRAQVLPPNELIALLHDLGVKEGLPEAAPVSDAPAIAAAAEQTPGDYPLQLVNALCASGVPAQTARLRALTLRFPNRAALHAHILRIATIGPVHVHRDEEYLLANGTPPPVSAHSDPD